MCCTSVPPRATLSTWWPRQIAEQRSTELDGGAGAGQVEGVVLGVDAGDVLVDLGRAVAVRIDVGTTRQAQPVEAGEHVDDVVERGGQRRQHDGLAAGAHDGVEVRAPDGDRRHPPRLRLLGLARGDGDQGSHGRPGYRASPGDESVVQPGRDDDRSIGGNDMTDVRQDEPGDGARRRRRRRSPTGDRLRRARPGLRRRAVRGLGPPAHRVPGRPHRSLGRLVHADAHGRRRRRGPRRRALQLARRRRGGWRRGARGDARHPAATDRLRSRRTTRGPAG